MIEKFINMMKKFLDILSDLVGVAVASFRLKYDSANAKAKNQAYQKRPPKSLCKRRKMTV